MPPRCWGSAGLATALRCSAPCRGAKTAARTRRPGRRCRLRRARRCARCRRSGWRGAGCCAPARALRRPRPAAPVVPASGAGGCGRLRSWWGPWLPPAAPGPGNGIRSEPLPAAEPAARFDPAAALASHRDLELLLDAVAGDFGPDADPAFEAWLVQALEEIEGVVPQGDG